MKITGCGTASERKRCYKEKPLLYLHGSIDDFVVAEVLVRGQFSPEQYRRDSVPLEAHGGRQAVLAAPEGVGTRRRPVARVIVTDPMPHATGRADHDVRAVHRIEVVLRRVLVDRHGCCDFSNGSLVARNRGFSGDTKMRTDFEIA